MEKKMLNVLIANMNNETIREMKKNLEESKFLNVISTTISGKETVDAILKYKPDIIIIDAILPEIDGIGVVENLEKSDESLPYIIVTTIKITNLMSHLVSNKKINLLIEKPIDYEFLVNKLKRYFQKIEGNKIQGQLSKKQKENKIILQSKIMLTLKDLSIKRTTKGYRFLSEAIRENIENKNIIKDDIFKYLEEKFKIKRNIIINDIRNSINYGYKQKPEKFEEFFKTKAKPSNLLFIEVVSKEIGGDTIKVF